jgi:hypothetical protein
VIVVGGESAGCAMEAVEVCATGVVGLSPGCCDVELRVGVGVLVVETFTSDDEDRVSVVDVGVVLVSVCSCVVLLIVELELPPFASTSLQTKPMSCSLKALSIPAHCFWNIIKNPVSLISKHSLPRGTHI